MNQGNISGIKGPGDIRSPDPNNYTEDMQGAKPGEVRGFEENDGSKTYVLRSNGEQTMEDFSDYVFNKKEQKNLGENDLRKIAVDLARQNGINIDPDEHVPANMDVVCQLREFAHLVQTKNAAGSAIKTAPSVAPRKSSAGISGVSGSDGPRSGAARAVGNVAGGVGGGLDIDD